MITFQIQRLQRILWTTTNDTGTPVMSKDKATSFSTSRKHYRNVAYEEPVRVGNHWEGWVEGYGETIYTYCDSTEEAIAKCHKQIDRFIAASLQYRQHAKPRFDRSHLLKRHHLA